MVETQSFHNTMKNYMASKDGNSFSKQSRKDQRRFPNGQIFIHLKRNKLSYFPGEKIEGSIMVQQ